MESQFIKKYCEDIMQVRAFAIQTAINPENKAEQLDELIETELLKAKEKYEKLTPMEIVFEELEKLGAEVKEVFGNGQEEA